MSINEKDNKPDGFMEDILSFDELKELEDLEDLQTQRKPLHTNDQQSHEANGTNLEEGELSESADGLPTQPQPQYLDSDHSDEEIMKEIQAKVRLSKKRRRQNALRFAAAPGIISYNIALPFPYPPPQVWPNGFYPPMPKPKKPVDLSLLDSDSDELTSSTKNSTTAQPSDPSEREEGSIDPAEASQKKRKSEEKRSKHHERKRSRSPERSRHKEKKEKTDKREKRDKREKSDKKEKKHKKEKRHHDDRKHRHHNE